MATLSKGLFSCPPTRNSPGFRSSFVIPTLSVYGSLAFSLTSLCACITTANGLQWRGHLRTSLLYRSCTPHQVISLCVNRNGSPAVSMEFNDAPRTDAFTQGCRDFIRSMTYEAILACTVYGPPMLFMIGPAAVIGNHPLITIVLHSLLGFAISWTIHCMGHRLLGSLPNGPLRIDVSARVCLPVMLTRRQFIWMLELLVAAGVFCGIAAKRWFAEDPKISLLLLALGLALYFLPVYLAKLWTERHYPAMTLLGPTEDVVNQSVPALRSFLP